MTDGQTISMSWCQVLSALKGFHPKNFNSTSGSVLQAKFWMLPLGLGGLHELLYALSGDGSHNSVGSFVFTMYVVEMLLFCNC
jgi:hypothetical protein